MLLSPRAFEERWVEQVGDQQYRVTEQARAAARQIIRAGYDALGRIEVFPLTEVERLAALLERIQECSHSKQHRLFLLHV